MPISRRGIDRLFGLFVSLRRFRCKNPECGWEGNLVKSQALRRTVEHMPNIKEKSNWVMLAANSIMLLTILVIVISLIITIADPEKRAPVYDEKTKPEPGKVAEPKRVASKIAMDKLMFI